jgi:hypothetical protein
VREVAVLTEDCLIKFHKTCYEHTAIRLLNSGQVRFGIGGDAVPVGRGRWGKRSDQCKGES